MRRGKKGPLLPRPRKSTRRKRHLAMAEGGGGEWEKEEERGIELQLEVQLEEQKDSLKALDEALAADSSNPDLLSVREELVLSIKGAEEGLLYLKRSRLLQEADAIASKLIAEPTTHDVDVEPLCPDEPEVESSASEQYRVGSKCKFRHSDGRWYNGLIVGIDDAASARVSFLNPTSESMLICKFFLQQRCWFGNNCRMSHGHCVPISSLKQYVPTIWQQSLVGSSIWAVSSDRSGVGIWKEAELESWDDKLKLAQVFFQDGTSSKLGVEALALSRYTQMSDEEEEEEYSSSGGIESSEEDKDFDGGSTHQGMGFLDSTISQNGVQTETALFAKWENHTRGIASKLMVGMGYVEGMGLGVSGQGIVDPISVKVLPPKQSLDHAILSGKTEQTGRSGVKKRSRGGKRKRDKRFAEAARAAKAKQEAESNVFSFINEQLAGQSGNKNASGNKQRTGSDEVHEGMKKVDRRSLVAHEDKVKELRHQVERLEEMVNRNRKDKAVYEAASGKLTETRRELSDAEAAHVSASNAVVSKEKEKRWLKF